MAAGHWVVCGEWFAAFGAVGGVGGFECFELFGVVGAVALLDSGAALFSCCRCAVFAFTAALGELAALVAGSPSSHSHPQPTNNTADTTGMLGLRSVACGRLVVSSLAYRWRVHIWCTCGGQVGAGRPAVVAWPLP